MPAQNIIFHENYLPKNIGWRSPYIILVSAPPGIRDKLKTFTGTGEDYDTAVQKLKEDLLADEPLIGDIYHFTST